MFKAHRDDSEFGYRLLADEARAVGQHASDRRVWRICSRQGGAMMIKPQALAA